MLVLLNSLNSPTTFSLFKGLFWSAEDSDRNEGMVAFFLAAIERACS
jgi:hypothetical protein